MRTLFAPCLVITACTHAPTVDPPAAPAALQEEARSDAEPIGVWSYEVLPGRLEPQLDGLDEWDYGVAFRVVVRFGRSGEWTFRWADPRFPRKREQVVAVLPASPGELAMRCNIVGRSDPDSSGAIVFQIERSSGLEVVGRATIPRESIPEGLAEFCAEWVPNGRSGTVHVTDFVSPFFSLSWNGEVSDSVAEFRWRTERHPHSGGSHGIPEEAFARIPKGPLSTWPEPVWLLIGSFQD